MPIKIFYSWQSDSPNKTNRSFIEGALKKAIEEIKKANQELSVENAEREEIILDKDTKGTPGQPDIVDTILKKISTCDIFVPDLTFVGKSEEGKTLMNPNVLIEYGWALNNPTTERFIPVMNTAFGKPNRESLPFDMIHRRHPIQYHLQEDTDKDTKQKEEKKLVEELVNAINLIINNLTERAEDKVFLEIPQEQSYS